MRKKPRSLVKVQIIPVKFHKIISFRTISNIAVNQKGNGLTITRLCDFPWKFLRFWEVILDGGFQSYFNRSKNFPNWQQIYQYCYNWCLYYNFCNRQQNIVGKFSKLGVIGCSVKQFGGDFLQISSGIVKIFIYVSQLLKQAPEVFCKKKKLLEISQQSQNNTYARVSFLIKLQAWDLQLH